MAANVYEVKIKMSAEEASAFAAIKNYSLAQQLVIDALYGVVRAGRVGSLALRLRAEQRLRSAEDDYRRAGEKLDELHEVREAEVDECSKPPEGWQCSRPVEHEGPCAARPRSYGPGESLADELAP